MGILEEIQTTGGIDVDGEFVEVHSAISEAEGHFLQSIIREVSPQVYLEVGLAFGVSAIVAGRALRDASINYRHHVIDPVQNGGAWRGLGLRNLRSEGLIDHVTFHEEPSEIALPKLLDAGQQLDMAFIDGWHTFDHALVDFFFINRMLRVGGVVVFDDANWPALRKLVSYVLRYPCYQRYRPTMTAVSAQSPLAVLNPKALKTRLRPSMVAVRKTSEDAREWNWYARF